jgi:hypothetical protein
MVILCIHYIKRSVLGKLLFSTPRYYVAIERKESISNLPPDDRSAAKTTIMPIANVQHLSNFR